MRETSVNMKFVRFGQVLTEVIEENRIQMRSLLRETGIKNERLYDIKKVQETTSSACM